MPLEIPEVVIDRLPVYFRLLSRIADEGRTVISSQCPNQSWWNGSNLRHGGLVWRIE